MVALRQNIVRRRVSTSARVCDVEFVLPTVTQVRPEARTSTLGVRESTDESRLDIWESQGDFDAFGPTLIPILSELGVKLNDPMIATVHNVIKG